MSDSEEKKNESGSESEDETTKEKKKIKEEKEKKESKKEEKKKEEKKEEKKSEKKNEKKKDEKPKTDDKEKLKDSAKDGNAGNLEVEPMDVADKGAEYGPDGKTVIKLDKPENTAFREDLEAEIIQKHIAVRIWMAFIWLLVTAVMIDFTYQIAVQYQQSQQNPASSIILDSPTELPMPTVIICNWNQDTNTTNGTFSGTCPECTLTFESCYNWNLSTDCIEDWQHIPVQTDLGLFDCYHYNIDPENGLQTNNTGYSGSISTVFSVVQLPYDIANRAGLQATFAFLQENSSVTPHQIYNEVNFAPVGLDTFYAIRLITEEHYELQPDDPNYNKSRYETVASLTTLLAPPAFNPATNTSIGYIGVSFSYQTLSKEEDTYDIAYKLNNLFGDFAGMIGTLMGLDSIKVASSFPMIYLAIRLRNMNPLEDHFNG